MKKVEENYKPIKPFNELEFFNNFCIEKKKKFL